jgi:hypothetical protein
MSPLAFVGFHERQCTPGAVRVSVGAGGFFGIEWMSKLESLRTKSSAANAPLACGQERKVPSPKFILNLHI